MSFSNILIQWYLQNKRDLPWRSTKNPYHIWLSEIILQQTRVDQGMEYYHKFIMKYPAVEDLAQADEEAVLKLWQGLGYYSRARNLHHTARYVAGQMNGKFPVSYQELIRLKGIGDYTASAIASICNNEPVAVVDGNVFRVIARYFGIETPIDTSKGKTIFKKLAQEHMERSDPGTYNQALMEFGARQCKPQNPQCNSCPLQTECHAFRNKETDNLPVKQNRTRVKNRYFNYIVFNSSEGQTLINIRDKKGIWQGLYEFPLVESTGEIDKKHLLKNEQFKSIVRNNFSAVNLFNEEQIIHKLSHQHLHVKFWIVTSIKDPDGSISWEEFDTYPVPVVIANFVKIFTRNGK